MATPARDLSKLVTELRRSRLLVTEEELDHRLPAACPTGMEALDRLLGGGLPMGRIVEFPGVGSGSTAMALSIAARGTDAGGLVAWVDRADAFDPRGAREAGVGMSRLLWCRPRDDRAAIQAADALLDSGAFPLVILDLGTGRQRSMVGQGAWLRLSRGAEARRSSLLVLGEVGAGTFAAATLRTFSCLPNFLGVGPGRTFEGMEIACRLERNKMGLPPGEVSLSFRAPSHFATLPEEPLPGSLRIREGR